MAMYNDNEMTYINEVYFGQTKSMTELFEKFCDFRNKYVTDRKIFIGADLNSDHDPDLYQFCRLVEKEFNIKSFSMVVMNNDNPNMCTINTQFAPKNPKKCLKATKTGFKFSDDTDSVMIVIAPTGLLFNGSFTNREVFAIFLHEVGHNFQELVNGKMYSLSQVNQTLLVYTLIMEYMYDVIRALKDTATILILTPPVLTKLSKNFNKMTAVDKANIYSYFNFVSGVMSSIKNVPASALNYVLKPLGLVLISINRLMGNLFTPTISIHGYYGEKMADKFASYYGFGTDLSTALLKFDSSEVNTSTSYLLDKIPLFAHFFSLLSIPGEILISTVDEHPGAATRVKVIRDALEHDLKDPRIPESMKKEIRVELERMDKTLDDFFKTSTKINNTHFIKNAFNRFIYASCGGGVKHAFSEKFMNSDKEVNNVYFKYIDKSDSEISKVKVK